MPFTRTTYPVRGPQRELKIVSGRFTGSATPDTVDSQFCEGATVTALAAPGRYQIQFDGRGSLQDMFFTATAQCSVAGLLVMVIGTDLDARTVTLVVLEVLSTNLPQDLGAGQQVHFVAALQDAT